MNHRILRSTFATLATLIWGLSSVAQAAPSHEVFDRLLGTYVVDDRFVQYDLWYSNPEDVEALHDYIRSLEKVHPQDLPRNEALAYWINLYNAVTLGLILDHYPVTSIKDLGGRLSSPWDQELVRVDSEALTLNKIENEILRPKFREPRIHFAISCASQSCPPLASTAYTGDRIEEQLEAAARRTITDPYWVDLSHCGTYAKGSIRLSKIFGWYKDDFGGEKGVRNFLAHYLPAQKLPLQNGGCSLDYNDYDWTLNLPPGDSDSR